MATMVRSTSVEINRFLSRSLSGFTWFRWWGKPVPGKINISKKLDNQYMNYIYTNTNIYIFFFIYTYIYMYMYSNMLALHYLVLGETQASFSGIYIYIYSVTMCVCIYIQIYTVLQCIYTKVYIYSMFIYVQQIIYIYINLCVYIYIYLYIMFSDFLLVKTMGIPPTQQPNKNTNPPRGPTLSSIRAISGSFSRFEAVSFHKAHRREANPRPIPDQPQTLYRSKPKLNRKQPNLN